MEKIKEEKILLILIIACGLLLSNYFYTFNNFVAFTQEERIAGHLVEKIKKTENSEKFVENLTNTEKEIIAKYIHQFDKNTKIKTIQEFYLEELIIILLTVIFFYYFYWRKKKTINKS